MTYADVLRPCGRNSALAYDAACVTGGSLFVALSAQFAFPLPFSPVPVTGQTLAVLLAGVLLGSRLGSLCLLAYLMEGTAGMPVFSGGMAGLARLAGPTGGYLIGLVPAAFVTGLLAEKGWDRRFATTALAMLAGNAVIYFFGLSRLAAFAGSGNVLALGLYPFIPGDIFKLFLAVALIPSGWKLLERLGNK